MASVIASAVCTRLTRNGTKGATKFPLTCGCERSKAFDGQPRRKPSRTFGSLTYELRHLLPSAGLLCVLDKMLQPKRCGHLSRRLVLCLLGVDDTLPSRQQFGGRTQFKPATKAPDCPACAIGPAQFKLEGKQHGQMR